jgi:hypothetical protein
MPDSFVWEIHQNEMNHILFRLFIGSCIVFLATVKTQAQTIPFQWLEQLNGQNASVHPKKLATDSESNIYITGYFGATLYAGNDTLYANNPPFTDIFLARCDSAGNIVWARSFGSADTDYSYSITTDSEDNVYICGQFYGDSLVFDIFTLYKEGNYSAGFWAKFSNTGQCLMAQATHCYTAVQGLRDNLVSDIKVDGENNILITGGFMSDSLCFGNQCITMQNAIAQTLGSNIYVAKLDASGNCFWLRGADQGTIPGGYDKGITLSLDAADNVYISGRFGGNILVFGGHVLSVFDMYEGICARLDNATGNVLWAKAMRGFSPAGFTYDDANGVIPDKNGYVYIGGNYQGITLNYDSAYTISTPVNTQNPTGDKFFLIKANASNGQIVWGRGYGNSPAGPNFANNWAGLPGDGRIAVAANYEGPGSFDAFSLPASSVPGLNGALIEFDSSGNVLRGVEARGLYRQELACVAYDATGALITAGKYSSPTLFIGNQYTIPSPPPAGTIFHTFVCRAGYTPLPNSIGPDQQEEKPRVWPNPATDVLHIELPLTDGELTLTITNLAGQVVMQQTIAAGMLRFTVNSAMLVSGCYVLSIRGKTLSSHIPFVQTGQ